MRVIKFIYATLLFFTFTASAKGDTASQIILQKRAAVSVSNLRFYSDSSFTKSTEVTFTEGELFEIIGQTVKEHYDNTQTQTFKWYKARSLNGQTGWIFGDNLAVVIPNYHVDTLLKPFFKKEAHFDNGFENSVIWAATVEGHDEHVKDKSASTIYQEIYLIVTNDKGRSITLNYAHENESGKKNLEKLYIQDVTDNKIDEIILETSIMTKDKNLPERYLEIYSFTSNTLEKIFEERLMLAWENDVPTPAFSKFVEIEGNDIRIAYVDYISCEKAILTPPYNVKSPTNQERCLEYVTYSFIWDKAKRSFVPFYKESRTPIYANTEGLTIIRKTPSLAPSEKLATIAANERLLVIKHFDLFKVEKGVKKVENWLYVKHASGTLGYVKADEISFKNIEHAAVLHEYYTKTPILKQLWKSKAEFLSVKKM